MDWVGGRERDREGGKMTKNANQFTSLRHKIRTQYLLLSIFNITTLYVIGHMYDKNGLHVLPAELYSSSKISYAARNVFPSQTQLNWLATSMDNNLL